MTEFGQDQEFSCRDKVFVCCDRVGQGGEVLCRDREFDVATRLPKIVLQQSTLPSHFVFPKVIIGPGK